MQSAIQAYSLLSKASAAAKLVSIKCEKITLRVSAYKDRIQIGHGLVSTSQVSISKCASSATSMIFLASRLILEYFMAQAILRRISMNSIT